VTIRTRLGTIGLLVVGAFLAAACSSVGDSVTTSTVPSTQGTSSTIADKAALIPEGESLVEGIPLVALLGPGSIGAGAYPVFRWNSVAAAEKYQLVVSAAAGPIWAWDGSATEIRLGAVASEPPAGYGGPSLTETACWSVVALDAEGHAVAASAVVPVSPGDEPNIGCSPAD
jgi:hypothetical protein